MRRTAVIAIVDIAILGGCSKGGTKHLELHLSHLTQAMTVFPPVILCAYVCR